MINLAEPWLSNRSCNLVSVGPNLTFLASLMSLLREKNPRWHIWAKIILIFFLTFIQKHFQGVFQNESFLFFFKSGNISVAAASLKIFYKYQRKQRLGVRAPAPVLWHPSWQKRNSDVQLCSRYTVWKSFWPCIVAENLHGTWMQELKIRRFRVETQEIRTLNEGGWLWILV